MTKLFPVSLKWLGVRFFDPVGRVFDYQGSIYRAVYPGRAGFLRSTWKRGVYDRAMDAGFLVKSKLEPNLEVDGYGPIVWHERQPFPITDHELSRAQALDYARLILDFNRQLAESDAGYGLIDAHGSNICQQDCGRPVWIDLGSIRALKDAAVGLEEFKRLWWRPLKLVERDAGLWRVVQLLLAGGISAAEFTALGGGGEPETPSAADGDVKAQRLVYLDQLRQSLPTELIPEPTFWANYHGENILPPNYDNIGARATVLRDLMLKLKPKTVIDLACANGLFSFMAARTGAQVLAADYDEGAITRCYATAKACTEPLSVTIASYDITTPRMHYPQADLVLALAVTHHISLTQGFPFSYIAGQLARFTSNALITEFMPNGLGAAIVPESLPEWYRLDLFLEAFGKAFKKVTVIPVVYPEGHSPRTVVLCEGPRTQA
jgi:hypothetical protein